MFQFREQLTKRAHDLLPRGAWPGWPRREAFHIDGFARDLINLPARLVIPVPAVVSFRDAACAPIAFGTVEHMLFDNAKLKPGETILVHAGGSGIGSVAIKMAKALGCTVITTVGDDSKAEKARALGADHVINYKTERFEGVTRKLTGKRVSTSFSSTSAGKASTARCSVLSEADAL